MQQVLVACLALVPMVTMAAGVDGRLAGVRKAFVAPVDDLSDDRPVAMCLADHLAAQTPITAVKTREEADVIFKVKAHVPSATTRFMVGNSDAAKGVECGLADELLDTLRTAMRKARDAK